MVPHDRKYVFYIDFKITCTLLTEQASLGNFVTWKTLNTFPVLFSKFALENPISKDIVARNRNITGWNILDYWHAKIFRWIFKFFVLISNSFDSNKTCPHMTITNCTNVCPKIRNHLEKKSTCKKSFTFKFIL